MPVPVSLLRSAREIKTLADRLAETASAQAANPRTEMSQLLAAAKDDAERARTQRAIESGRTKIGYHGTVTDFPEIDLNRVDLGLHVGTPEQASVRLRNLIDEKKLPYFTVDGKKVAENAQIMPIAYDPGKTLDVKRDVGAWNDAVSVLSQMYARMPNERLNQEVVDLLGYYEGLKDAHVAGWTKGDPEWHLTDNNRQALNEIRKMLVREGYGSIRYPNEVENLGGTQAGMLPTAEYEASELLNLKNEIVSAAKSRMPPKIEPPEVNDPDAAAKVEAYLNQKIPDPRNFMEPEEIETIHSLADRYNLLTNSPDFRNDPYSYIILNPSKARSINAKFDPMHKDSPDLSKAEGGQVKQPEWYEFEEDDGDGEYNAYVQKFGAGGVAAQVQRQWLKGHPEKSLALLKRADDQKAETAAINNWIDTSLAKYIKRDYGAPHDPLTALTAEQRHVPLMRSEDMSRFQVNAVWPPADFLKGDLPSQIQSHLVGHLTDPFEAGRRYPKGYADKVVSENPWLANLSGETPVFARVDTNALGLQHLRDELFNAIRPDSDLPQQLRLRPESLPRVSVAQASQLVGKINAWRASQEAAAELAASMNPATFIHKEYPGQNMRWVEIKPKDKLTKLPEGYSFGPRSDMSRQSGRFVLHHPDGTELALGSYATEEEALEKALRVIGAYDDGGYQSIKDAMEYESDHMHHCLGNPESGYCDNVFDGMSRVFSLRDKYGLPHVTIETSGPRSNDFLSGEIIDEKAPGTFDDYLEQRTKRGGYADMHSYIQNVRPKLYEQLMRPEIRQVKGHGDQMPVDRYLPFVQDFVKSQKWANVGDLHHTGLRRTSDVFNPLERQKVRGAGVELSDFLTKQEIDEINAKVWPASVDMKLNGMKKGGSVTSEKTSRGMTILDAMAGPAKDRPLPWYMSEDTLRKTSPPSIEDVRKAARSGRSGIEMLEAAADIARATTAGFKAQTAGVLPGSDGIKYSIAEDPDSLLGRDDREMNGYLAALSALPAIADLVAPGKLPEDLVGFSKRVGRAYGDRQALEIAKRGLPAYEDMSFPQKVGLAGGEMLAQIPMAGSGIMSKAPRAVKATLAAPAAILEYLGPTIIPSVGNYAGAAVAGALLPDLINKYLQMSGEDQPINAAELPDLSGTLSFEDRADQVVANELRRKRTAENIARSVYGYADGGPVKMGGGGVAHEVERAMTAAERAAAGRKAAELIKAQEVIKASEALGRAREQGVAKVSSTQADRTKVGGGNIGGPLFSVLSRAHPEYAKYVWGVGDPGIASRLTNLSDPSTAWTTMLGSAEQLKTNPIVFDKLKRGFQSGMKAGLLTDMLAAKINKNLTLTFGEGADIRDPKIWRMANTFEKRAALADVMMGKGKPPAEGGVAIGGEKSGKGVIFSPSEILRRETEAGLLHPEHGGDVPTYAVGPRLFTLGKEYEQRPDLHPAFPVLITGNDLGTSFKPVPIDTFMPDWHKRFSEKFPGRKPGYYDYMLGLKGEGLPSQEITDDYLKFLMTEGFAAGGLAELSRKYRGTNGSSN